MGSPAVVARRCSPPAPNAPGRPGGTRGRDGSPRLAALAYFSLGDDAEGHARRYLMDYYAFLGDFAEQIAGGALTSAGAIRDSVDAFDQAGCDELILFPCNPDVAQVELAAQATSGLAPIQLTAHPIDRRIAASPWCQHSTA